jgi:hypothetical protein
LTHEEECQVALYERQSCKELGSNSSDARRIFPGNMVKLKWELELTMWLINDQIVLGKWIKIVHIIRAGGSHNSERYERMKGFWGSCRIKLQYSSLPFNDQTRGNSKKEILVVLDSGWVERRPSNRFTQFIWLRDLYRFYSPYFVFMYM